MIEKIADNGMERAIIIRDNFDASGVTFVTPEDFSQQLAYMHHETGHIIRPHFHKLLARTIHMTQEVLLIKEGVLRVNFYNDNKKKVNSTVLYKGDIILLCGGGHGFEVLEEVKMIEVKQGPYAGAGDKECFIDNDELGE